MEPSIIHNPAALHEMTLIYKRDIEAARTKSGDDEKERKIYKKKKKKRKKRGSYNHVAMASVN